MSAARKLTNWEAPRTLGSSLQKSRAANDNAVQALDDARENSRLDIFVFAHTSLPACEPANDGIAAAKSEARSRTAAEPGITGKEEDVEVGLQYFGKRFLNPLLGRWVSADPLAVHAPGEADLNVYAYVSGQILRATDPLGLEGNGQQATAASSSAPAAAPAAAAGANSTGGQARLDSAIPLRTDAKIPEGTTLYQFSIHDNDKANLGITSTLVSESEMAAIAGRLPEYSVIFRLEADPAAHAMDAKGAAQMAELQYIQWTQRNLSEALSFASGVADVIPGGQPLALALQGASSAVDPDPPANGAAARLATAVVGKKGNAVAAAARTVSRVAESGPVHHLATNKNFKSTARGGPWSPRFEKLFNKAGMSLDDAANKVPVILHKGPHPEAYHQIILDRLEGSTKGLRGDAFQKALKAELGTLRVEANTPGSVLNKLLTK